MCVCFISLHLHKITIKLAEPTSTLTMCTKVGLFYLWGLENTANVKRPTTFDEQLEILREVSVK